MPRHLLSCSPAPGRPGRAEDSEDTPAASRRLLAVQVHARSRYLQKFEKEIETGIPNLFFYALIDSILFFFF